MDIYLPTADAGRVRIGTDARIVLDAYPDRPIPAKVTFIATQAQFTPKTVETKTERDKLMFRIRVRIDPELLRAHAEAVRSGLPGVAYVRLDPKADWPARLQRTVAMHERPCRPRSSRLDRRHASLWRQIVALDDVTLDDSARLHRSA